MSRKKGYSVYRRKRRNGKREITWTVAYWDGHGKRQYVRGVTSEAVGHEIGRAKGVERDRVRGGVITAAEAKARDAAGLAIADHITAWERAMKARGVTKGHYEIQSHRAEQVARQGSIRSLDDASGERVQSACARVAKETSPQNARHYFGAFKAFIYWCIETGRLTHDPLAGAKRPSASGEVFKRTVIQPGKLPDLLDAARTRQTDAHHPGEDRAMFYLVLAHTGLRRREAESTTPESYHDQSVTVRAGYTKNGEEATQPIRADAWALLQPWLKTKKPRKRVFNFGPHWNCEELFKADCAAAGIKAGDGERLGVHSLRRMYITGAIRAGGLAVAQDLARHSTPALTKKYSDLSYPDQAKALEGMAPVTKPEQAKLRKAE